MSYDSGFVSFCFWDVVRLKTSGVRSWDLFFFFCGVWAKVQELGQSKPGFSVPVWFGKL